MSNSTTWGNWREEIRELVHGIFIELGGIQNYGTNGTKHNENLSPSPSTLSDTCCIIKFYRVIFEIVCP
jgi:hypothetical protein